MLIDNHGRVLDYLRLAVTDRCNLRCLYCMPAKGLEWLPRANLLTFEEIEKLLIVFSSLGIEKLRFTGGEPFLRKDFMQLLEHTAELNLFKSISITTNGTLTAVHIPRLKELGIAGVNLSLDTISESRFEEMTRRDDFKKVMETFHLLMENKIPTKINAIIMEGRNEEDMVALTKLTKHQNIAVRFIEEMPFNGSNIRHNIKWNDKKIIQHIEENFGTLTKLNDDLTSTSINYKIDGFKGTVGVIPAFSRSFCGTCNRLRLTPSGDLKTCLYGESALNLRDVLRSGENDELIKKLIINASGKRAVDGYEAERNRADRKVSESMATIGG